MITFSFAAVPAPLAITKVNTYYAGYRIQSNNGAQNVKLTTTFAVPTVTCTSNSEYLQMTAGIGHVYPYDAGLIFEVDCQNGTALYSLYATEGPMNPQLFSSLSPGEKVVLLATENVMTGAISLAIQIPNEEFFGTFNFGTASSPSLVHWALRASGCSPCQAPVPMFTALKTTKDSVSLGSHSGSIGSYLNQKSDSVFEFFLQNGGTGHVVIKPTALTSTSTGFSLKWVQAN